MATIRIRNKKSRSSYGIMIALVVVLVLVIGAAYFYFKISVIRNSEEFQAKKIDYLIHVDAENPFYILIRNKKDYGTVILELPEYLALEPLEKTLSGNSLNETKKLIDSWLGISSDEYYYWETDQKGIKELALKFGLNTDIYQELLDRLSRRGLEFFDYWKLKSYVDTILERDSDASISKAGFAAILQRLSESSLKYFKVSTITQYPIEIRTSLSESPVKKLYLEEKSLEDLMALFAEW